MSALRAEVAAIIASETADMSPADRRGWLADLAMHGCVSGMVGELVYHSDTTAFFARHRVEISGLLTEDLRDLGAEGPGGLLRDWDPGDPFALEVQNQNLLAWYAVERIAGQIAGEEGEEGER